ncbi:hypothetical protein KZZ08_00545 [Roseovarius mucosus]|uniref:hypothetical protein n=1 Tax=Roseovarius mucosus TaxID=215743 RepID=UPI001C5CC7DB|nr:hypothetical protein [Roseovarius mucosus]MBW4972084.1 hypothetical protein [Roseovarius mucosus]
MWINRLHQLTRMKPLCAPEDEGAGGATPPADAGTPPVADTGTPPPAGDTPVTPPVVTPTASDTPAPAAKWWEDKRFKPENQRMLTAKGLTVDDPVEALAKLSDIARNAEQRLGKPADQLMDRPTKDQDLAEYLRQNGELFGVPEKAEDYKIARPDSWPKDAPWDDTLEAKAREIGHQMGLSQSQLQGMANLLAEDRAGIEQSIESERVKANERMQGELTKEWGDQYEAKTAQARQAFELVAEAAGFGPDEKLNVAQALAEKGGDPAVMKLFATIAEMAGDDMAAALRTGGGQMGTTPADARAKLAEMTAAGSEYMKAIEEKRKSGKTQTFDRLHAEYLRLNKIASGAKP